MDNTHVHNYRMGQSVQHKRKKLYEARFAGYSKSGKRIAVKHNSAAPWGVCMTTDYFAPENIEPYGYKGGV